MNKRTFKKLLLILFTIVLSFSFIACKEKEDDDKKYTVEDLTTTYTDELKLTASYQGKDFLSQGIGKVTLLRAVDGDTAHFLDEAGNTIKIRFLAINTPESTGQIAAWGKKASVFTKNKLVNAAEIVIEAEKLDQPAELDTTGSRYLGYVWYRSEESADFRLLNLEIIEQCFSYFTGSVEVNKYGKTFQEAFINVYKTKLRVFGEEDPDFNYTTEIREITIAELRNNYSSYSTGNRLKVRVRVVRLVGNSLYVEDIEETLNEDTGKKSKAGIFLYHSFVSALGNYKPGEVITFECQASDDEIYGYQLVNAKNLRSVEKNTEYTIQGIPESVTSLKEYEGFVVKVEEFLVTKVGKQNEETKAYTIYGKMKNGSELMVRIDGDVKPQLAYSFVQVGTKYDVIGGVSKFVDAYDNNKVYYQIKLGNIKPETINDFVASQNQN